MPTYEYQCDHCGHRFEEFQSITSKPIRKCPQCAINKVRRLIGSGSGVIFKGSGFYETDYRSESYKKDARADKEKTSGKTDSSTSGDKKTKSNSPAKKSSNSKEST